MSDKPMGRPPLEPRIQALEALCAGLAAETHVLKKQVAAMNDAFSNGNLPRPQYEQQFRVFPGASPNSNGT